MGSKKVQKVVVYIMLGVMLISTILSGVAFLF